MKIGVISDTHGVIHPRVFELFQDADQILHAGDIGGEDIVTALEALAPLHAVYGNIDGFPIIGRYPEVWFSEMSGVKIAMLHIFTGLDDPHLTQLLASHGCSRPDIVIFGHSHKAEMHRENGVLLLNPGSAGRRRFSLRPTVAIIDIPEPGLFEAEIHYLDEISEM
jgi:putative phosphoesterase